ncbi:hypothetical protein FXO38_16222 [Capsicum annuum]|nr:hypothetical protein FXO38_16222 [Capsicum annuum]
MNIIMLLRNSRSWQSEYLYEQYKSDGIIVSESITFLKLISTISTELNIDGGRKEIEVKYIVEGFVNYPLCISTFDKSNKKIEFDRETGAVLCIERTESYALALTVNNYRLLVAEEKRVNREVYKVARKKAKIAVMTAKTTTFENLYARERKGRDLDQVKCIKGENDGVLMEDVHIKKRWKEYFHRLLNDEGDRDIELGELEQSKERYDFNYCRRFKVEEVREAIHRMQRGRATGPDEISLDF